MLAKNSLALAKQGYELMDKKRNILIRELMNLIEEAKTIQTQIDTTFTEAYQALQQANIEVGIHYVQQIAQAIPVENGVRIKTRSIMGTEIPLVEHEEEKRVPYYGFYNSSESVDAAREGFLKVKELTLKLSMVENSAYRLAMNIRKTQKRANALKNITIPSYTALVKDITNALDEKMCIRDSSQIPLAQASSADTMESLIAALSGTPYKKVISDVYGSNSRELFDYELALDVFFFDRFWKLIKKDLKEEDQEVIARSVGTYIDALNLTWVYRAKKYYRMSAAEVYALIVPIHYRLTREQVRQMAEAADENELLAVVKNTKYGKYLDGEEQLNLERCMEKMQEAVHSVLLRRKPYSAACLDVYLYRKEREARKIITAMECVRYGLPSDKIREYLA